MTTFSVEMVVLGGWGVEVATPIVQTELGSASSHSELLVWDGCRTRIQSSVGRVSYRATLHVPTQ